MPIVVVGNMIELTDGVNPLGVPANPMSVTVAGFAGSIIITGGTITSNQGTPNTLANAWPIKISDGINAADILVSGGVKRLAVDAQLKVESIEIGTVDQGTPNSLANAWPVELSDGTFLIGTSVHPVRIDPTGTTTQPVSIAAIVAISSTQLPAALVGGRLDTNIGSWLGSTAPTVGSKTSTNSIPVVIASDQSAIPVSQSGAWTTGRTWTLSSGTDFVTSIQGTTPWVTNVSQFGGSSVVTGTGVSGAGIPRVTVSSDSNVLATQSGTWTVQQGSPPWSQNLTQVGGSSISLGQAAMAASVPVVIASNQSTLTITGTVNQGTGAGAAGPWAIELSDGAAFYTAAKTGQFPSALVGGRLDVNLGAWLGSTAPTVGQKTSANSIPVVIASDQVVTFDVGTADKSTFTYGTSIEQPVGGVFQDTSPSLTAGQTGAVRLTANRAFHINLRDASGNEKLGSSTSANSIPVVIASDQGAVSVSQSGTWTVQPGNTANVTPWLVTVATALPAGANTIGAVTQASGPWTQNLTQVGGGAITLGAKTSANSIPVVLATDEAALPVSQSGTWNINNISGTVSLPTGAATAANQTTLGSQTTKINDGTNTATVKAASTAAVAADHALVVAISPNNTITITGSATGFPITADGSAPADTNGLMIEGFDSTNTKAHRIAVDSLGRIITAPAGTTSSTKGFANGQIVLAATTIVAIRATTYTEQAANAQRSIVSSSASDAAAGTGARTVRITYYTVTMTGPFTETITMNGTTPVNTVSTTICFIEKIEVLTVGSNSSNVGTLALHAAAAGAGATIWSVAIGDNQTYGAHHYVATGLTCFITGFSLGIKGADTTGGFLRAIDPTVVNTTERQISDFLRTPTSGEFFRNYGTPIQVAGPARITAYVAPDSTSSRTYYSSFDFYDQ